MTLPSDLGLLSAFVAVAEERNFRRAADRLHVTQPVISRRIQRLEREVGVILLERTTRHVTLTDAGVVFLDAARRLLHDAGTAVARTRRVAQGRLGQLTIGFVESAAFELLTPLLRDLERRAPGLVLDLRELSTERQLSELHADVDAAIVRDLTDQDLAEEGLNARELLREPLRVALPARHHLAGERELDLGLLAEEPFVVFPRPQVPRSYDHVLAVCEAAGFQPRIATHALQYTTMLAFVAAGRGAALVPASVRAIAPDDVRLVPLTDAGATTHLSLAWRGPGSPMLETFLRSAASAAASAPELRRSTGQ